VPDESKKVIVLTLLPGGKRLASLREVAAMEQGRVRFETEEGRRGSLPWADCVEVQGGEEIAPGGLGVGIRRLEVADLPAGGDESGAPPSVLEVFDVPTGADFYLVRGPEKERREELLDEVEEAVPNPEARFVSAPTGYEVIALPEEKMRALGWVRAEDPESDAEQPED
jgi:hypothetical protein